MSDNFCVFILTHGRANNVITYNTLRKHGYTGQIILLVDNEDVQVDQYKKLYGEQVHIFDKQKAMDITDSGDNFNKRNSVVYARNYNFVVAKELGIKYFLQLDDDYTQFRYTFDNNDNYITKDIIIKSLDAVIQIMLKFYIDNKITTLAMSQGGDFIGGGGSGVSQKYLKGEFSRKAMNSFFCSTDRPFKFSGRINEDVNAYTSLGILGGLFLTFPRIRLEQKETQSNSGGLTDIYLDLGTYVKSFYSVMYAPSCVKITEMGVNHRRLHHKIKWKNAIPMVLSESVKK
mgnify:FL=1|tara:strand:- start:5110 stop:5973 length:864 start_codon:yes stop_codon:yes gene_type:complete